MPLQFSTDLDAFNPNTPEWREDVGLVVTRLLSKVSSSFGPVGLGVPGAGQAGGGAGPHRCKSLPLGQLQVLRSGGLLPWLEHSQLGVTSKRRDRTCTTKHF